MVYLLKCLVVLLQNPQLVSPSKYVHTLISKLGPTGSFYLEPPSSFDIATARDPNGLVTPIRISVPPRWPCQRSVTCCIYFGLTELMQSVSPSWLDRFSITYCFTSSHRVDAIGATEMMFALSPSTSVPPSCSSRSHRDS